MRVETDEDEVPAGPRKSGRLRIERHQVGKVLVDQAGDDEVVGAGIEAGVANLALAQRRIDATSARHEQHSRREIDPVDLPDPTRREPGPGPPGPAAE